MVNSICWRILCLYWYILEMCCGRVVIGSVARKGAGVWPRGEDAGMEYGGEVCGAGVMGVLL